MKSSSTWIWPLWATAVLSVWLYLLLTGPGFGLFATHWPYSVMMLFGSMVAGFTPEGGGAVAFPVLSLWFNISATAARDFSLAIQSIGMVSASVWILTRKGHRLSTFKWVPFYALVNFGGFAIMSAFYDRFDFKVVQMLFVSLALSFITAYLVARGKGTADTVDPDSKSKIAVFLGASFLGGCASAMFGTGADMLIYIALTCFYGMKEKISTDISIVLMATVTVFGIFYRGFVLEDIQPEVYSMWLAAAPVVLFFAPLGNILLSILVKEWMLVTVLLLNAGNYIYFIVRNPSMLLPTAMTSAIMFTIFISKLYIDKRRLQKTA